MTFDQDHVRLGRAVAQLARFAVFFAVEPFPGAVRRLKFKHYDALRLPVAFQHFCFTAADNVFAAVLLHGRTGEFLVFSYPTGSMTSISTMI